MRPVDKKGIEAENRMNSPGPSKPVRSSGLPHHALKHHLLKSMRIQSINTYLIFVVASLLVATQSTFAQIDVIQGPATEEPLFRIHVQPVLAKSGCNSGACHGALAGKGGFKLSLRGYDDHADWMAITRQAGGRRIELADPGRSLILAKPSGAIRHKGGLRFDVNSDAYRIIARWIESGAKSPAEDDPRMVRLEILPPQLVLARGEQSQIRVLAHFDDGHVEDVTRWVKYKATNLAVAKVDDGGNIQVVGHGEGAITAWYLSKIAISRVTSPYPHVVDPAIYANAPRRNFIDDAVLAKLQRLNLPPSPPVGDNEFIRRAYIDTIGTLPTAEQVQGFLKDRSVDKRDKLIDRLLACQEFIDYWTYKWSDILLVNSNRLSGGGMKAYYAWIRQSVADNKSWDQFARQVITATGATDRNGAANFYTLHESPQDISENLCVTFLGLNINCARCHNHPLEKWTNNQYYAMANLLSRVRTKGADQEDFRTVLVVDRGELIQPLSGKARVPTPLDGDSLSLDAPEDRRIHLAKWLTSAENPYFSRAITNRIWKNFFGVGLVEMVDDLRISNPASNEQLLTDTAQYLVDRDFDVKFLMRAILQSETYQRTSNPLAENQGEHRFYSRYYPRRMMAEVLLDAISQVTAVPTAFTEISKSDTSRNVQTDAYPLGTRALQLPDSRVISYFLTTFGRNERQITCECERSNEPSMVQVLHIANGTTINDKLQAQDNIVDRLLATGASDHQIIDRAYLSTLARYPGADEKQRLMELFAESADADRRMVIEDLFWSILSSREFVFNH